MPARGTDARKTKKRKRIFMRKLEQEGGRVDNLSWFTVYRLNCSYRIAYRCVRKLERDGLIIIENRGQGSPLTIRSANNGS